MSLVIITGVDLFNCWIILLRPTKSTIFIYEQLFTHKKWENYGRPVLNLSAIGKMVIKKSILFSVLSSSL